MDGMLRSRLGLFFGKMAGTSSCQTTWAQTLLGPKPAASGGLRCGQSTYYLWPVSATQTIAEMEEPPRKDHRGRARRMATEQNPVVRSAPGQQEL
jgi:hypothetical protein